eukprot:2967363-Rhodomonas_salina.1
MDKKLGLPSRDRAYSSILEFRDNSARYGTRAASAANKLVVVEKDKVQLVPGQDYLDVAVRLLDSLGQQVDGRVDPYVIEMVACTTAAGCSSISSLQPVIFLAYDRNEIRTGTNQQRALLNYCTGSSVVVKLTALTQDRNLEATLEVECLPCRDGQFRTVLRRLGSTTVLWSCKRCPSGQYIIDPNEHSCQKCPPGLTCQADWTGATQFEPVVAQSTWVTTGSYLNLTSCPTGYSVVNEDENGFNAEVQRCEECKAGEECRAAQCTTCQPCQPGRFKPAAGTAACDECPVNTYRPGSGFGDTGMSTCRECPDSSTTRGLRGQVLTCFRLLSELCVHLGGGALTACWYLAQVSIDACACRVNTYRQYIGASELAVCRECPDFSTTRALEGQVRGLAGPRVLRRADCVLASTAIGLDLKLSSSVLRVQSEPNAPTALPWSPAEAWTRRVRSSGVRGRRTRNGVACG